MILKCRLRMLKCRLKEVTHPLRFCNLNSPCLAISTRIDVYEPSEDDYRRFYSNRWRVFLSFRPPNLCLSAEHKHGISIHSLTNLSKTLSETVWIFIFFTSLILDFICGTVLMMMWQWKPQIGNPRPFFNSPLFLFNNCYLVKSVVRPFLSVLTCWISLKKLI